MKKIYVIIRKYKNNNHPNHNTIIKTSISLKQAQQYCSSPSSHEPGIWFDCYYEEGVPARKSVYAIPVSKICGLFQTKNDLLHRIN